MQRAGKLRANGSTLRPQTLQTLIGLIACTGLRINEALRLRCDDLDMHNGTLRVAPAKFSPERELPLHPSTLCALDRYRRLRQRHYPDGAHLFIGPHGRPMQSCAAQWTLRHLVYDFPPRGARLRPRFHDFRHSLATHLIARWSRQGAPIAHRLLLLSRYLGHKYFHNTYWYIEPERAALQAAATRFERLRSTAEDPA
jgi:integrase